jgi:hypothetical protein
MPLDINGQGSISGITSLNTSASVNLSETELGYLDGVTSDLQTQINAKAADSSVGLIKIVDQSFTSASAVSVNNCFSSTYKNYKIILNFSAQSDSHEIRLRLRASGSDSTATSYSYKVMASSSAEDAVWSSQARGRTQNIAIIYTNASRIRSGYIEIQNPQQSLKTFLEYHFSNDLGDVGLGSSAFDATTSFDGFSIIASAGNFTGTLIIYGYRN